MLKHRNCQALPTQRQVSGRSWVAYSKNDILCADTIRQEKRKLNGTRMPVVRGSSAHRRVDWFPRPHNAYICGVSSRARSPTSMSVKGAKLSTSSSPHKFFRVPEGVNVGATCTRESCENEQWVLLYVLLWIKSVNHVQCIFARYSLGHAQCLHTP